MLSISLDILLLNGFAAAIWLPIGVFIAARHYPEYNHRHCFLSELGARGAPTQRFSPLINNFPLTVLFAGFALSVMQTPGFFSIGICVFIHALATAMAGYFPMDRNYMAQPNSFAHRAHTAAGFIMFLSLFVAQLLGLWVQHWGWVFQGFSLSSAILSLFFLCADF